MNSGQISQMFAQQNSMFAGNQMYSQQISQQMPGMYNGMFGQSGGPGFSYASQTPLGYDVGSRASGGIMSAMGGAAHLAMGAGTLMAGMGMLGTARYALDPFAGAGAMYRMGGAMGMGMGGRLAMGAMGMLPAAGIVAGAGHVISSAMSGAQEQSAVERVLGQNFNFSNSATGSRGFNRQQGMAIGDMVRQLEHVPEMMTSMGELTRIMDKMGQMGMMNGVTNVRDFGSKFKSTLSVLKEMSKVVGSTMEEALPLFGEIRRSGMYSTSDVLKNAMQRQVVGGLTGMNQGQVGQVAAYGAQLGFATGGSRATGAQHALRMAGQLGMANQMGILSNDKIMELTGMEGSEGLQALSGQITQAGYRMSGSALGTAMSIAMAEQKNGHFTGKMDSALMERFRSGEISKSEMLKMVHQKTGSRGSKMSYVTKRGELRSEMAGQMGVEGQLNMLQMVLGERGYDNPDALNIVSQGFGLDERESGLLVELGKRMPDINIEMKQRGRSEAKRIAQESFMKQNYSWGSVKAKVGKKIEGVITEPFKQFGAELRNSINQTVDDFIDDITGKYKVEVTQGMSSLMRGAGSNLGDSRTRLASILKGGSGTNTRAAMSKGTDMSMGTIGSAMNWLTGNQTSGERMVDVMRDTSIGRSSLQTVDNRDDYRMLSGMGYNTLDTTSRAFNSPLRYMATSQDMLSTGNYLAQLSQGTIAPGSGAAGALGNRSMALARADFAHQISFGGDRGAAFGKLADQYGGRDVMGAIGASGRLAGFASEARRKLAEDAGLMTSLPDKGVDTASRIKGSERQIARIFGAEGGQYVTDLFRERQGTRGGEYLIDAFTKRSFLGQEGADKWTGNSNLSGYSTLDVALGRSGKNASDYSGLDRDTRRMAQGIRASIAAGDSNVSLDGRHFDTDKYFRDLAEKELAGVKLSQGSRAAIETNRETYEAIKATVDIEDVILMAKNGGNFNSHQKTVLKRMGYDNPDDFTKEEAEKLGKFKDLMNKASLSDKDRKTLKDYKDQLGAGAMIEVAQRIAGQGRDVSGRARALRKSGLNLGKEGETMLSRIEGYAGKMAGMTSGAGIETGFGLKGGTSYTEDIGSVAYDLLNMKDQNIARTLTGTDDDLSAAYSRARYVKQRLGKNKTFDTFFDAQSVGKMSVAEQERLGDVRKQYFDDKGNVKDAASFTKFLAGDEGQKFLTAAGAEQRSKYASQADIAKNMESFGQSVTSLAQIVQQMKDGKQPGATK